MTVVGLTEDKKIYIKNSSGKVIIDPLDVSGIFGCVKDVMQVSEFECEKKEITKKEDKK